MPALLALVGGFVSGIFFRSVFSFSWPPIVFALLLATLFAGAALFGEMRRAYALAALFFILVSFGMVRASLADTPLPSTFISDLKQRVSYDGIVVADPDVRDTNQRIEVRVTHANTSTVILAVASRRETVSVGDHVRVSGTLAVPEPFAGDNGNTFRYDKYLQRDGVRFMLNFAFVRVTTPAPWYSLSAALARAKHAFINGLNATLPEPYSSLAAGVVIGGKTGLGTDLQDAFTKSGLVQIIVLSGYNIMVVAEWVMAALTFTKLSRGLRAGAGALAILLFVGIAGASATALRAMLMAFIALYARATGKSYTATRALLVVIFLMLLWNPLYLAFDPGFDLSVAATAGLIYLAPIIENLLIRTRGKKIFESRLPSTVFPSGKTVLSQRLYSSSRFWTSTIATTLAAQLAVLPLLLYFTGNLSLVSVPANLIVTPIVPLAMALSALAGFAGMLFHAFAPTLGIILAFPAYLANAFFILVAQKATSLPLAAFTIPAFPFVFVLASYAAIAFIASSKRFSTTAQFTFAKNASI